MSPPFSLRNKERVATEDCEIMFCRRLQACLQVEALCRSLPRKLTYPRHFHNLASIQQASLLPQRKLQALLFPFSGLEPHLAGSVDRSQFQLFQPSMEALSLAEKLFSPSPSHTMDYLSSAVRMEHAPTLNQPEVSKGEVCVCVCVCVRESFREFEIVR